MGKIFYIIGKSATGKDKIYSRLMEMEELQLNKIVLYTTRLIRTGEVSGIEYHFVEEAVLERFRREGKLIEARSYHTIYGIWHYFMADDGQIDLSRGNYLVTGTLESYSGTKAYYGDDAVVPIYIEVETGERLTRALIREKKEDEPKYTELCRRFLADEADFSEENINKAGIRKRFENVILEDCIREIVQYIKTCQAAASANTGGEL